jgi:hypothetical protein
VALTAALYGGEAEQVSVPSSTTPAVMVVDELQEGTFWNVFPAGLVAGYDPRSHGCCCCYVQKQDFHHDSHECLCSSEYSLQVGSSVDCRSFVFFSLSSVFVCWVSFSFTAACWPGQPTVWEGLVATVGAGAPCSLLRRDHLLDRQRLCA